MNSVLARCTEFGQPWEYFLPLTALTLLAIALAWVLCDRGHQIVARVGAWWRATFTRDGDVDADLYRPLPSTVPHIAFGAVRLTWMDADVLRMMISRAIHEPDLNVTAADLAAGTALLYRLETALNAAVDVESRRREHDQLGAVPE